MSDDQDLDWLQDDKENNPIAEKKGRGKNKPFTTTERFESSKALYEEFTPEYMSGHDYKITCKSRKKSLSR